MHLVLFSSSGFLARASLLFDVVQLPVLGSPGGQLEPEKQGCITSGLMEDSNLLKALREAKPNWTQQARGNGDMASDADLRLRWPSTQAALCSA